MLFQSTTANKTDSEHTQDYMKLFIVCEVEILQITVKAAYSVTMNIFQKFSCLFKSFVKVELSYVFTIKMFSTAENCMEK